MVLFVVIDDLVGVVRRQRHVHQYRAAFSSGAHDTGAVVAHDLHVNTEHVGVGCDAGGHPAGGEQDDDSLLVGRPQRVAVLLRDALAAVEQRPVQVQRYELDHTTP